MMLARPRTELVVPMPSQRHRRVSARACAPLPGLVTAGPFPGEFQLSLDDLEEGRASPKNYIEVLFKDGTLVSECEFSAGAFPSWLGYLRPARDRHEQNLEAVRDPRRGLVYVRTLRDISKGEELLVWYGDELARECGIPILSPANIRGDQQYTCSRCLKTYKYPNMLKAHIRFRCPMSTALLPPSMMNGASDPRLLEHYYKHPMAKKLFADREKSAASLSLSSGALSSAFSPMSRHGGSDKKLPEERGVAVPASRLIRDTGKKEEHKQPDTQRTSPLIGALPHPMTSFPTFCLNGQLPGSTGALDPAVALRYYPYHPFYAQLYPQAPYCCSQAPSLLPNGYMFPLASPGLNPIPPQSPLLPPTHSPKDPPSTAQAGAKDQFSPVQISPMGFPLPSENAGEPLDLLPRSLYTSKSRKGHLCIYCGKLYSRKYGLKIHLRTHTGYKPLKCKVCHRPFGDPSNLNKHIRLHAEGETPYRCEYCGKVLVRRRDLERHIKSRHPNFADKLKLETPESTSPQEDTELDREDCGSEKSDSYEKFDSCEKSDTCEKSEYLEQAGLYERAGSYEDECHSDSNSELADEEDIDVE